MTTLESLNGKCIAMFINNNNIWNIESQDFRKSSVEEFIKQIVKFIRTETAREVLSYDEVSEQLCLCAQCVLCREIIKECDK